MVKLKGYCLPQWYLHLVKEHFSTLHCYCVFSICSVKTSPPATQVQTIPGVATMRLTQVFCKNNLQLIMCTRLIVSNVLKYFLKKGDSIETNLLYFISLMHGFCLSCLLKCISQSSWSLPSPYYTTFAHILSLSLYILSTPQGQFQQQVLRHARIHPLIIKVENDTLNTCFFSYFSHDIHAIMHFKAMVK